MKLPTGLDIENVIRENVPHDRHWKGNMGTDFQAKRALTLKDGKPSQQIRAQLTYLRNKNLSRWELSNL